MDLTSKKTNRVGKRTFVSEQLAVLSSEKQMNRLIDERRTFICAINQAIYSSVDSCSKHLESFTIKSKYIETNTSLS